MAPREFHYRWEWDLRSPPEALWPAVADTDRFNRDTGLPAVQRVPGEPLPNARRRLRFSRLGVVVEWEEEPFQWIEPRLFAVVRRYLRGPVASMRVRVDLAPGPAGGTHLVYEVWAAPRNPLGWAAIPLQIGLVSARTFARVFRDYDRVASRPAPAGVSSRLPDPEGAVRFAPAGRRRLEAAGRAMLAEDAPADVVPRLIDLVASCDDLTAHQLRPYELADIWGLPRRAVLETCLIATRAGLLEFEWHLLCPLCRGAKARTPSLGGVEPQVHCDTCNIDFEVNFERSVELTFHPNPAIRPVARGEYCIAGPRVTPHVVAQQLLAAGESRDLAVQLESGRYRLRTLGGRGASSLRADGGGQAELKVPIRAEGWPAGDLGVGLAPRLQLANDTGQEQLVILERQALSDQAVTGAEVIALQRFRDLFAAEALRPGERISVGSLAVVFTDLYGSTQLYNVIGDATAFGLVLAHFDVLKQAIAEEEGVIIKTMGDAVMAVFRHPLQALRAIIVAEERLAARTDAVSRFRLKAGIHYGPCIAVTLNDRLDYFGSTVNIASRLQKLSQGDDLVVSAAVAEDPEVADFLRDNAWDLTIERLAAELKGFDNQTFTGARLSSAKAARRA